MNDRIEFVGMMQALDLPPDAVLVLNCDRPLYDSTAQRLKDHVEQAFPGRKCLVLSESLKLGVVNPTTADRLERIEQDLKTVAAGIVSLVHALEDEGTDPDEEGLHRDLEGVVQGAERDTTQSLG